MQKSYNLLIKAVFIFIIALSANFIFKSTVANAALGCCQIVDSEFRVLQCWNTLEENCNKPNGVAGSGTYFNKAKTCDATGQCPENIGLSESICDTSSCRACDPNTGCTSLETGGTGTTVNIDPDLPFIGSYTVDLNKKPLLEVNIPGLNFSDVGSTTDETGTYFYFPWIGEMISALYKFLMAVVSIVAVVVIVIQGARVIASGGGEGKTSAYKKIFQAVVGLFIAWGSFALLYNINPALVEFNALKVKMVQRQDLGEDDHASEGTSEETTNKNAYSNTASFSDANRKSLEKAKLNRTIPIDFTYFGAVDLTPYKKRALDKITTFVIHNGGYTNKGLSDTIVEKHTPQKHNGANYSIDRNGVIAQHIGEELISWASNSVNNYAISVEMIIGKDSKGNSCNSLPSNTTPEEVKKACALTEAQYTALNKLIDDVITRTKIKRDQNYILGHCEIPTATHGDPKAFDWSKIGLTNEGKNDKLAEQKKKAEQNKKKEWTPPCKWYLPF